MFFVFDKQKIYSYIVAASTVIILFILSFLFVETDVKVEETMANTIDNRISDNNIIKLNK